MNMISEMGDYVTLSKVLTQHEIQNIKPDIAAKLENFSTSIYEELATTKVLCDSAQQNLDKIRIDYDQLQTATQDTTSKIELAEININQLRHQLQVANDQTRELKIRISQQESEALIYRKERNDIIDERDQLAKISERKDLSIERLQCDIKAIETQLHTAISSKCDALARLDAIEGKELTLEYKEKRMNNEKELLNNEIANLTENLNKNVAQLMALRQESTSVKIQLEIDLREKCEELKISNATIQQLHETNQSLIEQCDENAAKLKEQIAESAKLMEYYQKELEAKTKLADLYKENYDDSQAQTNELTAAVKELKRLLNETTDQCGIFETKLKGIDEEHQLVLDKKDEFIAQLTEELKIANNMLKTAEDEHSDKMLEKFAPISAATNRRLKSGLTLSEIYTRYYKIVEELQFKERECNQLKIDTEAILMEFKERVPEFERQHIEYKKILAVNTELTERIDNFIAEKVLIREELQETRSKFGYLERENVKLKTSQNDLARQVCYLLQEIEASRGGTSMDQDHSISSDMPANEVITKKLVTFNSIVEMQENNQKLLLLVRDLSTKLEEMEEIQNSVDMESYEAKISNYEKRLNDAEQSRKANEDLLANCVMQKERFKNLYYEIMKDVSKKVRDRSFIDDDTILLNESVSSLKQDDSKKLKEIEEKLEEKENEMKTLKNEFNEYRKETLTKLNTLNEKNDILRNEIKELTTINCHLSTQTNFTNEQVKTQQKNIATYKNQIQTLEKRNQLHLETIGELKTANKYLQDDAANSKEKLSSSESRCENIQRDYRRLMDIIRNLEVELQLLKHEKVTNNILQSNLEMIRTSLERSESDGRLRMEQRLDDAARECSALRRRLQEEQEHFREEMLSMKQQTEKSISQMHDELKQCENLRLKLDDAHEEIETKNQQIDELRKKIENSSVTDQFNDIIENATKRISHLEIELKAKSKEIENLIANQTVMIEKENNLRQLSMDWENEYRILKENVDVWKSQMASDLQASKVNEANLKAKIEELQTEIRLQVNDLDNIDTENTSIAKTQNELKEALQKINENNREIRDLHSECETLKINLQTIENKYSNEMQSHSSDIQTLTVCKDQLNKCHEEMDKIRVARDQAVYDLEQNRIEYEKLKQQASDERKEFEEKLECVHNQNTALHDHLQAQNNRVCSIGSPSGDSIGDRILTDEQTTDTSSENLLTVIKFLRREKSYSLTKVEVLKTENTRLLNELENQKKRLKEMAQKLSAAELSTNEGNVVSAVKYEDLMRKVETLNAMTDSNIHLREERDGLVNKVKELTERVNKVEDELFPLQEKNRELSNKNDEHSQMIQMLRTNVDHWRKRASDLVERNNKNPEDFKRLQNERENLAKMLTTEKENLRQVNDELNSFKTEKLRVDQELAATTRQYHNTAEERKKILEDLANLKQTNIRLTQEIIEIKNTNLKKEDEMKAVEDELKAKDALLTNLKDKEIQIRRIAKKYKDSYFELKTKEEERDADLAAKSLEEQAAASVGGSASLAAAREEIEKNQSKKIEELSSQLTICQQEIEQLRKDNENLKMQDEKNLLTEAQNRIATLTENYRQINRDYQASKSQLQTCEQSRSEHNSVVAALKTQYETKIKELLEQDASRQELISKLNRQIETFDARFIQLHRQIQQQGAKPSTSSGTIEKSLSDPSRTANVKPMATPTSQQTTTVTIRRGDNTPLASIRPMSVQNSRTVAVHPTSQNSNIATLQGSSSGNVSTALVPPQQVHTTGNSSTAEAMSSSPTSSHTDYMPATSSAVVVAVPPMGSTSAESTQEAESLSVNTNESSSSSSTCSQAVLQQQTVALVSPRVEVTPQNVLNPSQQIVDQNQAASTSGSSGIFLTAMSTHHQASSSSTVTTTQAGSHKRPRDAEGDSSSGVEESTVEKTSPQSKRSRLGEQTFQGVTESGLDVEYQVPTSSQRDQEDDVVAVDSEDDDDDGMDDEATVDVDEAFDGDNGDTDEIESFGQDEGEGHDIDEDNVPNDTNEVDVNDSSDAPMQSTSGISPSTVARVVEVIELSPLSQETQQIQTISSGSDAGTSAQGSAWRQIQPPVRQQQQNLVVQQTYEEIGDDSIVPSTPTLYATRRADGFGEAVSSPHSIVPHASRFTFNESGSSSANRSAALTLGSTLEGMDDTRMDLNLLDETGDGVQGTSTSAVEHDSERQEMVVVDLVDESSNENKEADQQEPIAGPSNKTDVAVPQIMITEDESERHVFDDSASTSHVADEKSLEADIEVEDEGDVGTDGVSSEGEKSAGQDGEQVEEGREAEASIQMTADNVQSRNTRSTRRGRGSVITVENQRPTPIVWNEDGQNQQASPHVSPIQQMSQSPSRGQHIRGSPHSRISRGGRARRVYRQ